MKRITVIIPTFNRPEKLKMGLTALERQTDHDFSVLIVNDGSLPENLEKYLQLVSNTTLSCKLISQENKGIAGATNTGINAAPNGLIILTDDDIIPSPTFIEQHRKHHATIPDSILTGKALFDLSYAKTDVQRYKNFMDEEWIRILFPEKKSLNRLTVENFTLTAANMSFEKKLVDIIGGFREDLKDCQDFEFGLRAFKNGIPIYYDLNLMVHHNDSITLKYYANRQQSYARFKKKALDSYPEYSSIMNRRAMENYSTKKNKLYDFLSRKSICNFIENSPLIRIIPRFIRYRIYGSTIAALSREVL